MRILALLLFVVAGCGSDAPHLLDLRCTPSPLSVSGTAPYRLGCTVEFDGAAGDVRWSAFGPGGMWSSGSGFIDTASRDAGVFAFTMSQTQAPQIGTLSVTVSVDHVEGIDGPAGDTITTQVEVVP